MSGIPIEPVYGPDDAEHPGEYPYTRGPYASMYRSKLWTMRMFAGFGTAIDTNGRFKDILANGGDGLSTAFDLPTLMGCDSDDEMSLGEVGTCGVAVDTQADMEDLFRDIDLEHTTTSMTINSPAAPIFAMFIAAAEKAGMSRARLGGTLQNDILKEYQAQKEFVFPPRPSLRLVRDTMAFCAAEMPRWHAISVSGYHIREAGSTAAQELAFTLGNGFAYVELGLKAGLKVDDFAPRLSFFFNAHNNLLGEVAKFRAARRLWARIMRERFGARDPRSQMLRFHAQTAGSMLTAQQPLVNVVRTTVQALARRSKDRVVRKVRVLWANNTATCPAPSPSAGTAGQSLGSLPGSTTRAKSASDGGRCAASGCGSAVSTLKARSVASAPRKGFLPLLSS